MDGGFQVSPKFYQTHTVFSFLHLPVSSAEAVLVGPGHGLLLVWLSYVCALSCKGVMAGEVGRLEKPERTPGYAPVPQQWLLELLDPLRTEVSPTRKSRTGFWIWACHFPGKDGRTWRAQDALGARVRRGGGAEKELTWYLVGFVLVFSVTTYFSFRVI